MPRARNAATAEMEQSEGYLASVSDLMAALIFVFILTVAVFALRLAETVEELTDSRQARADIVLTLAEKIKSVVAIEVAPEHGVLHIREADEDGTHQGISFPVGRADPTPQSGKAIGALAHALAEVLPCYVSGSQSDAQRVHARRPQHCGALVQPEPCEDKDASKVDTLLIEGHTDKQPFVDRMSGVDHNLDLSSQRAAAVFREMTACQPVLEQFANTSERRILGVSGYGAYRQEFESDDKNRRIDLRFMMELPEARGANDVIRDVQQAEE